MDFSPKLVSESFELTCAFLTENMLAGGTKGRHRFNCCPRSLSSSSSEPAERDEAETSPFVLSDGEDRRHLELIDFPFDIKGECLWLSLHIKLHLLSAK